MKKKISYNSITLSQLTFLNNAAAVHNLNGVRPHWIEYGLILFEKKKRKRRRKEKKETYSLKCFSLPIFLK